jgi:nitroreductase
MSAGTKTCNAQDLPGPSAPRLGTKMDASGEAETPSLAAFVAVMRQRRSVRAYLPERIPDSVLNACFDLAILAPTSHNLECWQMIDVRDSIRLAALRHLCLDQPAAANAPHLIVAVARPDLWRRGRAMMLEHIQQEKADPTLPKALRDFLPLFELKYRLQIPLLFEDGPFHILAPLKRLLVWGRAWFKPMMRGPFGRHEQALWAIKTAALACENLMLALTAHGFDSCPMEGFDEPRVKRLLGLPRAAEIVMVIAAGRGAEGGVIPQIRSVREHYIARA